MPLGTQSSPGLDVFLFDAACKNIAWGLGVLTSSRPSKRPPRKPSRGSPLKETASSTRSEQAGNPTWRLSTISSACAAQTRRTPYPSAQLRLRGYQGGRLRRCNRKSPETRDRT